MTLRTTLSLMMLSAVIGLPAAASALDIDSIIESAKAGNGTYIETSASASTGGQRASSGQSVRTDDASASASVSTTINADSSGGQVHIETTTSENGVVTTETYTKPVAPGESAHVDTYVEAHAGGSEAAVKSEREVEATTDAVLEEETAEPAATPEDVVVAGQAHADVGLSATLTAAIPNFLKKLFAFLWRF